MGLPSISSLTIARALAPWMSATTTLMRIPASVSTLCSRFFSALHMPTNFCRWRATRRSWRKSTGGTRDARSSPARASVASHCASAMSVLRPGTALTWRALTTQAMIPTASSAANGLFQYTPVLSMTTTSGLISSDHCARARRSRLKAPKSRLMTSTRPSSCSTTAHAVILARCTSSAMTRLCIGVKSIAGLLQLEQQSQACGPAKVPPTNGLPGKPGGSV